MNRIKPRVPERSRSRLTRQQALLMSLVVGFLGVASVAGALTFSRAHAADAGLLFSTTADRSAPKVLQGATVSPTDLYVYFTPTSPVTSVRFSLDSKAVRTDAEAPFDLKGGSSAAAQPFNVAALKSGLHSIYARVIYQDGRTKWYAARFTVAASGSASSGPVQTLANSTSATQSVPTAPNVSPPPPSSSSVFDPRSFDWASVGRHSTAPTHLVTNAPTVLSAGTYDNLQANSGTEVWGGASGVLVQQGRFADSLRAKQASGTFSVSNSTVTAGGTGVVGYGPVIARYNFITGTTDGIDALSDGVIEYNKIWRDGTRVGVNHHDGIQLWQGGNVTIRRNWISGWQTSAIMIKSDVTPIRNVTVTENYLANPTGYYDIYVRDGGQGRPQMVTITNNWFARGSSPISSGANSSTQAVFVRSEAVRAAAIAAGNSSAREWIVWSGNRWADTGAEIVPPGGWTY